MGFSILSLPPIHTSTHFSLLLYLCMCICLSLGQSNSLFLSFSPISFLFVISESSFGALLGPRGK